MAFLSPQTSSNGPDALNDTEVLIARKGAEISISAKLAAMRSGLASTFPSPASHTPVPAHTPSPGASGAPAHFAEDIGRLIAKVKRKVAEAQNNRRRANAKEARRRWEKLRRARELRLQIEVEEEWRKKECQDQERLEEERRRWEQREESLRHQAAAEAARPQQEVEALPLYEAKWEALLRPEGRILLQTLGFGDVPWPLFGAVGSVQEDITWQRVREFVFHPQRMQGTSQVKSIRLEMLRWHPDKFERKVLDKIIEGDREAVKKAAGHVVRILTQLSMEANDR